VGLLLGLYNKVQIYFTHEKSQLFGDFRQAIQYLLALLSFSYWIFLEELPVIRFEKFSKVEFSGWKAAGIVVLFLVLDVALSIPPVVTDFLFANQLLTLSRDQILTDRDQLFVWAVLSFISSGIGLLCGVMKLALMLYPLFPHPSIHILKEISISNSIFGAPSKNSWKISLVAFIQHAGDDLIQLLAVAYTARFTGLQDTVGMKLAVSIFTVSMHLANGLREFVFGKKIARLAKVGLQLFYFFMVAISLSIFFATRLDDSFCELNRTANDPGIVGLLGTACSSISGMIALNKSEVSLSQKFVATSISTFQVVDNAQLMNLTFSALTKLNSGLTIVGNSGTVTVTMDKFDSIGRGSSLTVQNNGGTLEISLPVLFEIEGGGSVAVRGNSYKGIFSFPGLTSIKGTLDFTENSFSNIQLPILQDVEGTLTILGEQLIALHFPSLFLVPGEITLLRNSQLKTLSLPSLGEVSGLLVIKENNALENLDFPQIMGGGFNTTIESNTALSVINLSKLVALGGQLVVADNGVLQDFDFSSLFGMENGGKLIVSSNPSLTQLAFPLLVCGNIFSIVLRNNTNLVGVYVQDSGCLEQIVNEGNPNLVFYCNGTACS